jgi:hypothetical protein
MLRQCETVGARAFDADSRRANPERESLDPGKALPSLAAVIESSSLPSSSTALAVSVPLWASIPMTLSITTSLVPMQHDVGHRSDNNPLSSTRFYQARTDGP